MTKSNEKKYECPDCGQDLEPVIACGAESYFCNTCKKQISRTRIKGHSKYDAAK